MTDNNMTDNNMTDNNMTDIHESMRNSKGLTGVLNIASNKTYGKIGNKMLYKCHPNDKSLPIFLIPYSKKIAFSKKSVNIYVTFDYVHWNTKHPIGSLTNSLGCVNEIYNFYEYQLHCKQLNISIKHFTCDAEQSILTGGDENKHIRNMIGEYPNIRNKLNDIAPIFAIDPKNSKDYDDAVSIDILSDTDYILCVYISNVSLWMDKLDLWDSFTERVSTVYLPNKRLPMLPKSLSEGLCSLMEQKQRIAFTCEFYIKNDKIVNQIYYNSAIVVHKNFDYDDKELMMFLPYQQLFERVVKLNKPTNHPYIKSVTDSHEVVNYLMVLMNDRTGNEMNAKNNGIYRSLILNPIKKTQLTMSAEASTFIEMWNTTGGEYVLASSAKQHDIMNLKNYIHITSPIRRLVDLLNMIQFQVNTNMVSFNKNAVPFLNKWLDKLLYINKTMKSIRKVQNDCSLLHLCTQNNNNDTYNRIHRGLIFKKDELNDNTHYTYSVYLYDIKLVSSIKLIEDIDIFSEQNFKVYMFYDEYTLNKKIKLLLV